MVSRNMYTQVADQDVTAELLSNGVLTTYYSNNNSRKTLVSPLTAGGLSDEDVSQLPGTVEEHTVSDQRKRTFSVDHNTQTANGSIAHIPKLHIPGETGELANELTTSFDEEDGESAVTPDKMQRLYAQFRNKKIRYKLTFSVSVVAMLTLTLSLVAFPWFIPYFHSTVFPTLVIIRIYVYWKKHWQLFCLDFCYFGNLFILVCCWAFPESQVLQAIAFGATNGPIAMAVIIFRNSIVYHDYDRMTSAYIHLVPVMMTYVLRWSPVETSRYWYSYPIQFGQTSMYTNETAKAVDYLPAWVDPIWLWVAALPFLWFTLHMLCLMFFENCICSHEKYLTSFRWLTGSKSSVYNLLTICGRMKRHGKIMWLLFNLLYAILSLLVARLCYEYVYVHTGWMILLALVSIYNGASFFIDVFAKRGLQIENA